MRMVYLLISTLLLSESAVAETHVRDFVPLYGMTSAAIQHAIDAALA